MRYDRAYHALLRREGNVTIVTFPDLPECNTFGDDEGDALISAREALGLALRLRLKDREDLPPARFDGGIEVSPPVFDTLKLAVILAFTDSGIRKTELAHRIGKVETEARRILDPMHHTELPLLEAALAALGKHAVVTLRDTAQAARLPAPPGSLCLKPGS